MIVGIIGNKGKCGLFFERIFAGFRCEVIGADVQNGPGVSMQNREVVERADVVVFSVPPRVAVKVIKSLVNYSRPEQLWMDVTSLKKNFVSAMLESRAEVLGLHPMCAPTAMSLKGQTVVMCPARLKIWLPWVEKFIAWTGIKVKFCEPDVHDKNMSIVQGLVHAMQLTAAATIQSLGQDIAESLAFASPVYRIALSLSGRILKQDPNLYADIQMLNPYVLDVLCEARLQLDNLIRMIESKDVEMFTKWFNKSRDHFGKENLENSYQLFEEINQLINSKPKITTEWFS